MGSKDQIIWAYDEAREKWRGSQIGTSLGGLIQLEMKDLANVKRFIENEILGGNRKNRDIYISTKIFLPGMLLDSVRESYIVPYLNSPFTIVAFVDMAPGANLGHEHLYLFLNYAPLDCYLERVTLYPPRDMDLFKKVGE